MSPVILSILLSLLVLWLIGAVIALTHLDDLKRELLLDMRLLEGDEYVQVVEDYDTLFSASASWKTYLFYVGLSWYGWYLLLRAPSDDELSD